MNPGAFPLAARQAGTSVVEIGGVPIGGPELVLIAGPCSVESEEQLRAAALAARAAGATVLRGGAFKPRTSPYAFQGLGEEGLALLRQVADETGLPVVTEALEPAQVPLVAAYADAIQIGSRNMHVTPLLRAAATSGLPVLLKRGMSATLEEFLLAAETVLLAGNESVVLCERGIRTFDSYTRNCLDVGGMAALKHLTRLPVVADPSHATGRRELVTDAALAAIAAGADGLIVEAHPDPDSARSDADQQLCSSELADLAERASRVGRAIGRTLPSPSVRLAREARADPPDQNDSHRAKPDAMDPFIRRLREQIVDNDRKILEGINTRLDLVRRMRTYKNSRGIAFRDPDREESLLRHLEDANPGPLSREGLEDVLLALLDLTKREVAWKEGEP
ncbi:MAG TPA: bifunctional 3-deoxy-7-phosphoheptulonate synthase/chorismate mutase [Gaiellaceae bacterium]|nr:bifunctional 3-deoxy-7-phosphoheptulonate synthase/chorismate mutase [Gaiellaceae bacterium]